MYVNEEIKAVLLLPRIFNLIFFYPGKLQILIEFPLNVELTHKP